MQKPNLASIVQLMRGSVDRLQEKGAIKVREDRIVLLQEVFPFKPGDVESVSYAEEPGCGVRFHLRNGRVFDDAGQPV